MRAYIMHPQTHKHTAHIHTLCTYIYAGIVTYMYISANMHAYRPTQYPCIHMRMHSFMYVAYVWVHCNISLCIALHTSIYCSVWYLYSCHSCSQRIYSSEPVPVRRRNDTDGPQPTRVSKVEYTFTQRLVFRPVSFRSWIVIEAPQRDIHEN